MYAADKYLLFCSIVRFISHNMCVVFAVHICVCVIIVRSYYVKCSCVFVQ